MPIQSDHIDLNSLSSNRIKDLMQDEHGTFWITTQNRGLNAYDPMEGTFQHYRHDPQDPTGLSTDDLLFVQNDQNGQLWISCALGMNVFDPETGKSIRILPQPGVAGALQGFPWSPIIAERERIYVCTTAGLEFFDQQTQRWHLFPLLDENGQPIPLENPKVFISPKTFCQDHRGLLWIGVPDQQGLWTFDPANRQLSKFNPRTPDGTAIPRPQALLEDRSGRLWIASEAYIWRLSADRKTLEQCEVINSASRQRETSIVSMFQDHNGLIWLKAGRDQIPYVFDPNQEVGQGIKLPAADEQPVKTEHILLDTDSTIWLCTNRGLLRYDPLSGKVQYHIRDIICYHAISWKKEYLLVSSAAGLLLVEKKSGQYRSVRLAGADGRTFPSTICAAMDHDGDLWVSTWGEGLYHLPKGALNMKTGIATRWKQWKYDPADPNSLPSNLLQGIAVDAANQVWVTGAENGLNRVDKSTQKVQRFLYEQGNVNGIIDNYTYSLLIDRQGDIWITSGRRFIQRFSPETGHFKKIGAAQGFPNYTASEMSVDTAGHIWLNLTSVIARIDPRTEEITTFPQVAAPSRFNGAIAVHPVTGQVYYTINQELQSFHPDSFRQQEQSLPPLRLSGVSCYDPTVIGAMRSLPGKRWKETALSLSHLENTVEIEFALLDYRHPDAHEYAYALTKADDPPNWIFTGNTNAVSFSNLSPGRYQFLVKGRNSYGVWSAQPTTLQIIIRPPWWASRWAYLGYALAIGTLVWLFYKYQLRQRLAQQETLRLRELDAFKNRFFTNITHEFRTPLTVILGTSQQVEAEASDELKKKFRLIRRNGENLLRLINQILDLAKLESQSLKMNYVQGDVLAYLRYISESLLAFANAQNILLRVESTERELLMDYDPERLLQIVYNLLSNAIKFTPSGGKVTLSVQVLRQEAPQRLLLTVQDTGIGIPPEDLPHIFDRFYQVNNLEKAKTGGTGIGLALTKELVQLMGGTIAVESEPGQGTTFTVQLPITRKAEKGKMDDSPFAFAEAPPSPVSRPPSPVHVLIIEDNPDVVQYLTTCLEEHYTLDFAYNGSAGIEKALASIPDLIVSDVMMPEKNGFEVCDFLKNDERTSHIPIVLLTAKADVQSRLTGLRRGADAYLAKPFHEEELLVTLENLLTLRKKLQAKYAAFSDVAPDEIGNELEDAFLQKVRTIVLEHLSDSHFSVEDLCRLLTMSQPQLHRKLTALTGKNATLFIRSIRLAKGKELLQHKNMTVSEVAYAVGFTDPKYFSRVFSAEFGLPPSKI